ncbi:hypothetical protein PsorP6_008487 [Peronosclerospora sorghi]|uniref:Uncharacterized protein n=1 Tax=Peronosclerospora sorghi TaxID=230839 RepID=A0ACC0W9I5_9STRA|nr:hypothetical protein PsorP6_008487 [Peronosclerospora sorghi]
MEMSTPSKVASAEVSAYLASKRRLQLRQWVFEWHTTFTTCSSVRKRFIRNRVILYDDTRDAILVELIAQSEDLPMQLPVWNVKSQTTRELQLTPSCK